jgi:hypothetical protein
VNEDKVSEFIDAIDAISEKGAYPYSARGMDGRIVVGVTADSAGQAFTLGLLVGETLKKRGFYLDSRNMRPNWETMGRRVVLFWNDMPWPKDRIFERDNGDE